MLQSVQTNEKFQLTKDGNKSVAIEKRQSKKMQVKEKVNG